MENSVNKNFISFKDFGEPCTMDTKSKTNYIIDELFESFLQRFQERLEEKLRESYFACDSVDLFYYNLHKTPLRRGKSYIKSPEWLKNKRATINPKTNDDNCFQYARTVAFNHQNIENHPERISKFDLDLLLVNITRKI